MASPQPTPFVRFSKELFEAFYQNPPVTVASCRLWLWVLRWTWADFGKDETEGKTLSEIAHEVGVSRASACRELKNLVRCRRLKVGKNGGYAIQKDYDIWRDDTKKRAAHFGNQMKQMNLGIEGKNDPLDVPNGGTDPFHRVIRNRSTVAQSGVPPYGTGIRRENTVENGEGARTRPAPNFSKLPNNKNDTPRNRAELGHEDYAPDDHPRFKTFSFNLQDELTEAWKESRERDRRKTLCKKACGRPRASDGWAYCRPCTACARCGAKADGKKNFNLVQGEIVCEDCKTIS